MKHTWKSTALQLLLPHPWEIITPHKVSLKNKNEYSNIFQNSWTLKLIQINLIHFYWFENHKILKNISKHYKKIWNLLFLHPVYFVCLGIQFPAWMDVLVVTSGGSNGDRWLSENWIFAHDILRILAIT